MWNRLLICSIALGWATNSLAESDTPADALQPANWSEVALLMERLAALEQRTAKREAELQNRIDGLEKRLRLLEYQQPIHRVTADPRPNRNPGPPISLWNVQWLETGVRWLPNGDFAWNPSESTGTLVPHPYQTRCSINPWWYWRESVTPTLSDPSGHHLATYWLTPPWSKSDPLQGGYLLGTDLNAVCPRPVSFFDEIESYLNTDADTLLNFGIRQTGW